MIMAFVELSLAITPAYVISLSLSLSPAKLIFFLYVIWGFEDNPSGDPKQLGQIAHLTSKEALREVRVCVVYVELHSFVARVIIKVPSLHATSKYGKVKSL